MTISWEPKKLTPEQEKGTKFEIWLEELLSDWRYKPRRNVEYCKGRGGKRQVDVVYLIEKQGRIYTAMVEAKYSSNGTIPNKLRTPKLDKKVQLIYPIDTIIKDIVDRRMFIAKYFFYFDYAFLITNKQFDNEVKLIAPKNKIVVIERDALAKMHIQRGGKGTIDDSINAIDYRKYLLSPTNEYAR